MTEIAERVERVRSRMRAAAGRAGRDPAQIKLVAATKGVPPGRIDEAARAGLHDFGENRAQDLRDKVRTVQSNIDWHFFGHIQTNKVRYLDPVRLIHGLTRLREAEALQARGERTNRAWDVLVEVNVAGEASKGGVTPDDLSELIRGLEKFPLVSLRGLMIVAPQAENHEDVRWVFKEGRRLRDEHDAFRELSMGMTEDFEVAIEEGATIVRVGRAIFH
jgi:pyridoxal phosphate enzyme (YggS family)